MVCFYVTDLYTRCTFNHGRLILSSFVSWPCFRSKFLLSFFYSLRPKTGTQKLHRNPWVYPKCIVCRVIIKALCGNHVVKNVIIPAYYVKTSMIFFTFLKSLSVSFFFGGGVLRSLSISYLSEREREGARERERDINHVKTVHPGTVTVRETCLRNLLYPVWISHLHSKTYNIILQFDFFCHVGRWFVFGPVNIYIVVICLDVISEVASATAGFTFKESRVRFLIWPILYPCYIFYILV